VVDYILLKLKETPVLVYENAPMGAGKTTLSSAICKALGVDESEISSPTYSIINEYEGKSAKIFHLDLYRLKDEEEAFNAGVENVLHSGNICLVEWPGVAKKLLPDSCVRVDIKPEEKERIFTIY
jgi:tRNA threonylcarbamoyladenosine biosynthesis protein TsaE